MKTLAGFALIALVAGPAGAQTGAPPQLPPPSGTGTPATTNPRPSDAIQPGAGAAAGVQADAQVGFGRRVQLTPQEEVVEADRSLSRMEGAAMGIRKQLEQARQQRDVVKTLCLNDKLSQTDVAIRSARDRSTALKMAAQRNDVELANHEFTILTVLRQRTEQLTAEANQCIGEESAFIGDTQTTMLVDPNLPVEDTTAFPPLDPIAISEPPKCTSCSR
ncbi:hypothetical protein LZC95_17945 [Pendulispora brunnea]|uniref:Uncharacterized protein n=1 Tax=Pendulispora brunnea TaxID=2905690 RepID=A0ABZ2KJ50_9BACT